MRAPFILFILSSAGLAGAILVHGLSDMVLLAGPMTLGSLYLLARAALAPRRAPPLADVDPATPRRVRTWTTRRKPKWVVIDGSNVMHWMDETPRIDPLRDVLRQLEAKGLTAGVVFDANAGYLIAGKYQHDHAFGRLLGLPEDRIMVVPKGTPADPMILTSARDLGARIVTNDRYRDWVADYPEIAQPGHLIRGGYHDGKLWLDLDQIPAGAAAPA